MRETQLSLKLRNLRAGRGFTQQNVADAIGIERSTYAKYENAQAVPPFHTAVKLAGIYGVSIAYFSDDGADGNYSHFASDSGKEALELQEFLFLYRSLADSDKELIKELVYKLSGKKSDKN